MLATWHRSRPVGLLVAATLGTWTFAGSLAAPALGAVNCPALKPAQIQAAAGEKFQSLSANQGQPGKGNPILDCFYTLGPTSAASIDLRVYKGTAEYALLLKTISDADGSFDGSANAADGGAPDCVPARDGECDGKKFNEHTSPLAGLGDRAFDDPGSLRNGAVVAFTWKGNTYYAHSNGPYATPGPALHNVISLCKLVIRTGYKPTG